MSLKETNACLGLSKRLNVPEFRQELSKLILKANRPELEAICQVLKQKLNGMLPDVEMLEKLPDEMIKEILFKMDYQTITNMCQVSRRIRTICQSLDVKKYIKGFAPNLQKFCKDYVIMDDSKYLTFEFDCSLLARDTLDQMNKFCGDVDFDNDFVEWEVRDIIKQMFMIGVSDYLIDEPLGDYLEDVINEDKLVNKIVKLYIKDATDPICIKNAKKFLRR